MDVRSKACSYLRAGRVDLLEVQPSDNPQPAWPNAAGYVRAVVKGFSGTYLVGLADGNWTCCPKPCAHVAAVQVVTGWPSLARKAAKR